MTLTREDLWHSIICQIQNQKKKKKDYSQKRKEEEREAKESYFFRTKRDVERSIANYKCTHTQFYFGY